MARDPALPIPGAPLRAALVGCGRISDIHIETLTSLSDVDIVAVCDLDRDRAAQTAARHDVAGVFDDVPNMLDSCAPDVVHILTPPRTHRALVEAAAERGAHLYVEKPMATNAQDARAMLEAARRAGVQICPGHSRLFDSIFIEAQRRIGRGDIGQVVSVRAEQGFTFERAAHSANVPWSYAYDWGIYDNLMPHPLYLVSQFLEKPKKPIVAAFDRGSTREAAVEELRVLIPSQAACGEVAFTLNAGPERNLLEVVGTEGRITVDWSSMTVIVQRKGALPSAIRRVFGGFSVSAQLSTQVCLNVVGFVTGRLKRYSGMRALIAAFYRCLQAGTSSPVTAADGLLNAQQLEDIRAAAESKSKPRRRISRPASGDAAAEILVTGGTGMVGNALVGRLADDGLGVRATTRLQSRVRMAERVEWVRCDILDEDSVKNALVGIRTVYHCAALVAAPGSLDDFEAANVRGTLRLVELAREAGVEQMVYLSSVGVYGCRSRRRQYLDETAPYETKPHYRGHYTQTKLAAERELLQWAAVNAKPQITVLRPGTIYGPDTGLPVGRLRLPSSSRRPLVVGGEDVALPLTHVENLIDVMLASTRQDGSTGRIFDVVDDPDLDQGTLSRMLMDISGDRVRVRFLPYPLAWTLMLSLDLLSAVRHRRFGTARYRLMRTMADLRFPSRAARDDLGWQPHVSLNAGLRELLERSNKNPFPY